MTNRQRIRLGSRRVGKSPALSANYDGPGSPLYLMQIRLSQLLRRMRNTLSFPMPIDEFLLTVYPSAIFEPISTTETTRWGNLAACLNTAEIAHFNVEGRGENETFWVRHPKGVALPVPSDASVTLGFDRSNPYFMDVSKWLNTALEMQFDLTAVNERAGDFLRTAKHPHHVEHYWPELYGCVAAALEGKVRDPIPKINTRALDLPIRSTRDEITTMLAKCSMLPDSPCQAWVQYPREP